MPFIHDHPQWPNLTWDQAALTTMLAEVRHKQGFFLGKMAGLGFSLKTEAVLQTLTQDVVKSSEIEGETLDRLQVRSSIARRMGLDVAGLPVADRHVEGVVAMMLDATTHYQHPLSDERLFGWHAALFPTGFSGMHRIKVGAWRDDSNGPMQVVSGPIGRERVHFQAPEAHRLPGEMAQFLAWFNDTQPLDPVLKAGVAHLWFVTLHPFEDGNGRMARALADMALARAEASPQRFYSMATQIREERTTYYDTLEHTQKGDPDITPWLSWFLGCLSRAIDSAEVSLTTVLQKARVWDQLAPHPVNDRQQKVLNRLLDGNFEGHLTSSKYAKLAKCSQDTAHRDIVQLVGWGVLVKRPEGGRSTSYQLIT